MTQSKTEEQVEEEPQSDMPDLRSELVSLLNRYNRESVSNTPDFILRDFIWLALTAFESGIRRRDKWYGINPEPGVGQK